MIRALGVVAIFGSSSALGYSMGINTTQFPMPAVACNGCHGGGAFPTVTLTGPATLATGQSGLFEVTVTPTNGIHAGFTLSANASGPLALTATPEGAGVQIMVGSNGFDEATHTAPKLQSADTLTHFQVTWTPPQG